MRKFTRPFNGAQRQAAVTLYRQWRRHLSVIQTVYPARNRVETRLLRAYRHAVRDFARELLVANDKVNPALLNALSERADQAWSAFQLRRCIERLED